MAMINCPQCGEKISDKVAICPNCNALVHTNTDVQKPTTFCLKTGLVVLAISAAMLVFGIWAFSTGGVIFVALGAVGLLVGFYFIKDYVTECRKYHLANTDYAAYEEYIERERKKNYEAQQRRLKDQEFLDKQKEEKLAKKYNNYKYKCPMCNSNKIMNISTGSKVVSTELWGLASNKIGKTYQCDDCKYMW